MIGKSAGSRTCQRQAAAIGLLQQMAGKADHVADAGNRGDVAQDDVKIDDTRAPDRFCNKASRSSGRAHRGLWPAVLALSVIVTTG